MLCFKSYPVRASEHITCAWNTNTNMVHLFSTEFGRKCHTGIYFALVFFSKQVGTKKP